MGSWVMMLCMARTQLWFQSAGGAALEDEEDEGRRRETEGDEGDS